MSKWTINDIPDQSGRVIIVTGANSGLGYEAAQALASRCARVIMACRNVDKAESVRKDILRKLPNASIDLLPLNLGNLASIRDFAKTVAARYDRLDVLINNAGVMAPPRGLTSDGFEMQLGVNHLGHFALTGLLLPLLRRTPNSRMVSVSSMMAFSGKINFDDLQSENNYKRYTAYSQSKLANLLFAFEFQRKLSDAGIPMLSVAAHPGYSRTNLQGTAAKSAGSRIEGVWYVILNRLMAQSQQMGALPELYAATAPDVQGGAFYGPRWLSRGYPKQAKPPKAANNIETAARLWDISEKLTGVVYDL
jgi:NAD(P)-dependent dehydrogenase (short-subunit alcohol dehydrogenase family)